MKNANKNNIPSAQQIKDAEGKFEISRSKPEIIGGCSTCKVGVSLREDSMGLDRDYNVVVKVRVGNMVSSLCKSCYQELRESCIHFNFLKDDN